MQKSTCLVVDSRLETLNDIQAWFAHWYHSLEAEFSWVRRHGDRLNIAVAEGFTNAVRHAHGHLPPETPIKIEVHLVSDRLTICIWDHGQPFDPNQLPEPEPGSLLCHGGYGWFLLRRAVDRVTYRRQGERNCLEIMQNRHPSSPVR
ncbi:ATP-binding protein [Leptolyngbya iicbica]|uniref:ATP-binding protein n=2 Tax=Cyanophyceae TaxID=3028117 RepID=A0A4Q7EAI1_9CYAN|nr:anti-sigma regulatory factor [Leptolyngbya sp. LK]RZM79601.1 ATP-binding protein [Leptolyngbya sp. LK]